MTPAFFHASSIFRYSVILFCRFLTASRLAGLMFSSPMNTRRTPARAALSMKLDSLWHSMSTWMINRTSIRSPPRQLDDAIEDWFPILVAGEIVVGDEEAPHAFGVMLADQA